jgi:hypothetical protein
LKCVERKLFDEHLTFFYATNVLHND